MDERIDDYRVQILRTIPEDEQFAAECHQLLATLSDPTAFQAWAWIKPTLEYPQRMNRLRLIRIYQGDQLIGLLPLTQSRSGQFSVPGEMTSDYLDPPIHPEHVERFWTTVLIALRKLRRRRQVHLHLPVIPPDCPALQALSALAQSQGYETTDEAFDTSARIDLSDTWDTQLARLAGRDRKELKRKLSRAVEQGGARMEIIESPDAIEGAVAECLKLMTRGGGGKARKARWLFAPHFAGCARALAREGRIRVYRLLINDALAASLIALPQKSKELLWCGAFDCAFKQFSPGITLFAMIMQNAIDRQLTYIDLLRGQQEYKYRLGAINHPLHRVLLTYHPHPVQRLLPAGQTYQHPGSASAYGGSAFPREATRARFKSPTAVTH